MGKNGKAKKVQSTVEAASGVPCPDSHEKGKAKTTTKEEQEAEQKANLEAFRGKVEQFLVQGAEIMKSNATRQELTDASSARPNMQLIEIQKRLWTELGVEPKSGYAAVDQLEQIFPDSAKELLPQRQELGKAIHQAFMTALEDRRPQEIQKDGEMNRQQVLEFFDAKDVYFDKPEVRDRLKKQIETDGKMPGGVVEDVHSEITEMLGLEWQFVKAQLKKFGDNHQFEDDAEVTDRYKQVHEKTFNVCMMLMHEYRKHGGKVDVDDSLMDKLLELRAREELRIASAEECNQIFEKNSAKLKILSEMPLDGRVRYLKKLDEEHRLQLAKAELILTNAQQRMQAMRQAQMAEQMKHMDERPIEHVD